MSTNEMMAINASKTITSLELVEQINMFRGEDGKELKHNDLLKVVRDEFDEEIREGFISPSQYSYKMPTGGMRNSPMFVLTLDQAKQVLVRESKKVRKAVIKYIKTLENAIKESQQPVQKVPVLVDYAREVIRLTELTDVQTDEIKCLESENSDQKRVLDSIIASDEEISLTQASTLFQINRKMLIDTLINDKKIYRSNGILTANKEWVNRGYFSLRITLINGSYRTQTLVTKKGIVAIAKKYGYGDFDDINQ